MRRASLRVLSLVLLVPLTTGCADTVQPYLGGLKLGVTGGSYQMPVLLNETLPFEYPHDAWRDRVGGQTLLYIHISREGVVDSVMVLQTSGHASLDSAALTGARELRFRPAHLGTEPVDTWGKLPIRFPMPEEVTEYP